MPFFRIRSPLSCRQSAQSQIRCLSCPICPHVFFRLNLKASHHFSKLFVAERIYIPLKAFPVQIPEQGKILSVGNSVHFVTVLQIIQHFQIYHVIKQILIFMRVIMNIPHQLLVYLAVGAVQNLRRQDGININTIIGFNRIFP